MPRQTTPNIGTTRPGVPGSPNYDHRYAFSGADCRTFGWFPVDPYAGPQAADYTTPRPLESMHTISYSIHEPRGAARALGFRAVKGFSESIRTIAGSIIFTVIDDHPLRALQADDMLYSVRERLNHEFGGPERNGFEGPQSSRRGSSWSMDLGSRGYGHALAPANSYNFYGDDEAAKSDALNQILHSTKVATLLSPFNLLLLYTTEVALSSNATYVETPSLADPNGRAVVDRSLNTMTAAVLLQGVRFIDEGFVTSVNDIVSEMTFNFVCEDVKEFAAFNPALPDEMAKEVANMMAINARLDGDSSIQAASLKKELDTRRALERESTAGEALPQSTRELLGTVSSVVEEITDSSSSYGESLSSLKPGPGSASYWDSRKP